MIFCGKICGMTKKTGILFLIVCLLAGCGSKAAAVSAPSQSAQAESTVQTVSSDYATYENAAEHVVQADNWTAGVTLTYEMQFGDHEGSAYYDMDGTIAMVDENSDARAHVRQNIHSDGMESQIDGYYENGRLYNTYNGVTYYEDMQVSDVKQMMLVPLTPVKVEESQVESVSSYQKDGSTWYVLKLNSAGAESLFTNHYDQYGLNQYSDYKVLSGEITQAFDAQGHLADEAASFESSVVQDGINVSVSMKSEAGFLSFGSTDVSISDEQQQAFASYVNYKDIDTSRISDIDASEDEAADTVTETLRKRIVTRLGYKEQDDGTYKTDFNEHETYVIDFDHYQFTYSNYTSSYVYNWKGDTGGFGSSCSYDFNTGVSSEDCDQDVREMIQKVKEYFVMELYYCGVSLQDLQAESK